MCFFQVIDLSFPFPLFGGVHRQLTVSTAGALLTGNPDDVTPMPSHIAPFLSHMTPNERDTTIFYNEGTVGMRIPDASGFQMVEMCLAVQYYLLYKCECRLSRTS